MKALIPSYLFLTFFCSRAFALKGGLGNEQITADKPTRIVKVLSRLQSLNLKDKLFSTTEFPCLENGDYKALVAMQYSPKNIEIHTSYKNIKNFDGLRAVTELKIQLTHASGNSVTISTSCRDVSISGTLLDIFQE